MGAKIHREVKEWAKQLYEDEGYSPQQIVNYIQLHLEEGKFTVPNVAIEDVILPRHRSDINSWVKKEGWTPHWREAKKKVDKKIEQNIAVGVPFAISGITDPIWHLAILEAQRYVADLKPPLPPFVVLLRRKGYSLKQIREAALTNQKLDFSVDDGFDHDQTLLHSDNYDLGNSDQELTAATAVHVYDVLRPGPRVLLRLHPIIQYELKRVREMYRWFENFTPDSDNPPFPCETLSDRMKNPSELWDERFKDKGTQETQ